MVVHLKIGAAVKIFGKICLKAIRYFFSQYVVPDQGRGHNFWWKGIKKTHGGIQQKGEFLKILGMEGFFVPPFGRKLCPLG